MAECFSFDVVSDFERQELVNTLDQVKREISQRYDLKGTDTTVDLDKENIFIITNSELSLNAVNDIIRQKAIKRNLSLKILSSFSIIISIGNIPPNQCSTFFKSIYALVIINKSFFPCLTSAFLFNIDIL